VTLVSDAGHTRSIGRSGGRARQPPGADGEGSLQHPDGADLPTTTS